MRVNAHEVRAIATSVLFRKVQNMDFVLKAGKWRCTSMSTFADFYLRDVTHKYLDTFSLGPLVFGLDGCFVFGFIYSFFGIVSTVFCFRQQDLQKPFLFPGITWFSRSCFPTLGVQ